MIFDIIRRIILLWDWVDFKPILVRVKVSSDVPRQEHWAQAADSFAPILLCEIPLIVPPVISPISSGFEYKKSKRAFMHGPQKGSIHQFLWVFKVCEF